MAKANGEIIVRNQTAANIFLIGFMASGKTSTGHALAARLGLPFADTDLLVEKTSGLKCAGFIERRGLKAWRRAEISALRRAARVKSRVIALGGGILPTKALEPLFKKNGTTVYLECGGAELFARLAKDPAERPLLGNDPAEKEARLYRLLKKRRPFYEKADIKVNTAGLTPEQTAAKIARSLKHYEKHPGR